MTAISLLLGLTIYHVLALLQDTTPWEMYMRDKKAALMLDIVFMTSFLLYEF